MDALLAQLLVIGIMLMGLSLVLTAAGRRDPWFLTRPIGRWGRGLLGRTVRLINRSVYLTEHTAGQWMLRHARRAYHHGGWFYILPSIPLALSGHFFLALAGLWNFLFPSGGRRRP